MPRETVYRDGDLSVSGLERQLTEIPTFLSSMWFQLLYSPNKTVLITHYQRRGHFYSGPDNKLFAKLCLGRQFTATMTVSLQPKLKTQISCTFMYRGGRPLVPAGPGVLRLEGMRLRRAGCLHQGPLLSTMASGKVTGLEGPRASR